MSEDTIFENGQPQLPRALAAFQAENEARIGEVHRRDLGIVDARLIGRYALAIGDANPIYHDAEAARQAGFDDVVAPPNLLAGIVDWSVGRPETALRPDGTPGERALEGLKVMGAGESMEIFRPVTAGMAVSEEEAVEAVSVKQGRQGPLVFVTSRHDFFDQDGRALSRNRRTILARA